ncbi:hypothetical protein BD410DRAFT_719424 [Rickenella mellea]|uniref:Phosphatidic acid phosphatase type 2/haloperoxidase domain-containing protein n=1 Tax=Rickenella mellea TaxID=50990 RepID=A0A4Y7QB51_9AGAM|nr:hypothetical protein BD410DRAFT_719424 [Rickenella mellea]
MTPTPTTIPNGVETRNGDVNVQFYNDEKDVVPATPGTLPDDRYDTLSWWRVGLRLMVMKNLKAESEWVAAIQNKMRTPWLDSYFVYTSSLGTHTFFMITIPAICFFGHIELGNGLIFVLGMGVYLSSFMKDAVCSPRPYSPPVTRLTIGTHHLEYGFPSTHSTNSISIALYIHSYIRTFFLSGSISPTAYTVSCVLIAWYGFSIVFGRLYTAMHSFTDCAVGVLLGTAIWAGHELGRDMLKTWVSQPGWSVPLIITVIGLVMVNQHPQPIDDCPCFEDAIAFVSVIMGSLISQWHGAKYGFGPAFFSSHMPGSGGDDWAALSTWWLFAALKMVVGVLIIFMWRLLAKSVLHTVLPPVFRLAAHAFTLPTRRFYTPATDYSFVPPEKGLHPIPSVIDLPSHLGVDVDGFASGTSLLNNNNPYRVLTARNGYGNEFGKEFSSAEKEWYKSPQLEKHDEEEQGDDESVKHYDADVLTKVLVYEGIGALAAELLPVLFEVLGWGVHP